MKNKQTEKKECIHYLKVLQKNYCFMQPEIRKAIDFAIIEIELAGTI